LRVGVIGVSLCLLMPSVSSDIGGFGEFGERKVIAFYTIWDVF